MRPASSGEILTHPLFKADYEISPNLEYWKIETVDNRLIVNVNKKGEEPVKAGNGNAGEEQKNQGNQAPNNQKTINSNVNNSSAGKQPEKKDEKKSGGVLGCFKKK